MTLILTSNVRTIRTSPPNSFKPADFVQNLNTNTSETTGKLHECAMGTPEKHAAKCTQNTEQWFARSQVHRGGALGWHTVIKKKKINHQRRITPGEHTQDTAPRGQHFAGSPCSCEHGTQNGCCTTAAVAAGRFPAPSPEEQNQYAGEAPLRQWETSCAKTKRMDLKITKQKAFLQSL